MPELKKKQFAIVVLASVPFQQFSPHWFSRHKLINPDEEAAAMPVVQDENVSMFKVGNIEFMSDGNRVQITTEDSGSVGLIYDLIEGVFSILKSSLVRGVGFNTTAHYKAENTQTWHDIGHKMAPKQPWGPILTEPGLLSIRMQGVRIDGRQGFRNVILEPSKQVVPGIHIHINEHIQIDTENGNDDGVTQLIEVVRAFKENIIATSSETESYIIKPQ